MHIFFIKKCIHFIFPSIFNIHKVTQFLSSSDMKFLNNIFLIEKWNDFLTIEDIMIIISLLKFNKYSVF